MDDVSSTDSEPTLGDSPMAKIKEMEGVGGLDTDIKSRDVGKGGGSRDMILLKCKQAIENLHFEVDKQKQENEVLVQ